MDSNIFLYATQLKEYATSPKLVLEVGGMHNVNC